VRQHEIEIDGASASYWEYGTPGEGPTLLFVHGFRGDHHGLEPVIAFLPGVHIIAPDLPGFGLSEPLPGEHSIDGYAAWVRAFGAAIGLDAATIVLGHSFGTIVVARALAAGLPAARAILVNPIAAPALSGPNALGTRLANLYYFVGGALPESVGGALLKNRLVVRGSSIVLAKTKDKALRRWIHNQHDRYFSGYANRRVVLEAFRASVGHDVTEWAAELRLPVHLVAAEHDDITFVKDVEELERLLPDATLTVIPDVGHLVHYETPEAAAREIARVAAVPVG
jgi:pimeloyl-ACP methyl ester carboxylesterase